MDKAQQKIYSPMRSPFTSSNRSRLSLGGTNSASARKPYGGYNLGASPSIGSPSRYSASVHSRSNQSILGIRSEYNVVESYGFQLPVMVNEALTFSERSQNVTVKCSENGWAWVVHQRRLLIWQYKDARNTGAGSPTMRQKDTRTTQRRGGAMAQCRELFLPQCDLGHKATLVNVFFNNETQQMASCLAVAPTGDVRFWSSIAHDTNSIDENCILVGQEFDCLLEMPVQQGFLLVTTTCSLVLVQLQLINGRYKIQQKVVRQPTGFLGGIGKKFASIIGTSSANEKENKFVSIVCEKSDEEAAVVSVLSDCWLQRWRLSNKGAPEQLLYENDEVIRKLREEFQMKFSSFRAGSVDLDMHLLDMHIAKGKLYVLAGVVNMSHTPQMFYGIGVLETSADSMQLSNFIPIKLSQFYSVSTEQECLSLRFIICRTHLYLYTDKVIYPVNLANPTASEIDAEKIEFHLQDDRILSAAVCGQIPLFFSRTHGLICVTPSDFDAADMLSLNYNSGADTFALGDQTMLANTFNENNLYVFDLDPDAILNELSDDVSQLKAAFVYRLKRDTVSCNTIINNLMRNITEGSTAALSDTNQLDKIVITIAEDLAEDMPAADPRWEQMWGDNNTNNVKHALGSSSSLQILTQLKEKNLALHHFVEFLHATGLWDKLTAVPSSGGSIIKPTAFVISDINEKIIAAIALKTMQSKYAKLVDEAILHVIGTWNKIPQGNLTAQDIFYVQLCKFQNIFVSLVDTANGIIASQQQTATIAARIADINTLILQMLAEVNAFRAQNCALFALPGEKVEAYEYLPWTAMSGDAGIRDALSQMVDLSVRHGVHCTTDADLRHRIYEQIVELVDCILDGRKNYLESVRDTEKYNVLLQQFESQRKDLISILVQDEQYELAAKLAEKYLDFQSLVLICDKTQNKDRLNSYISRFEDYNFSQFAINWHMRNNKPGDVFERFKENQTALTQYFRDHPEIGWIQMVNNGEFERASKILLNLAQNETEFVKRKRTMLATSKLCALAGLNSDPTAHIDIINNEQIVINYQAELRNDLLLAFGYDTENTRVIKPEEMITMLISEENSIADERDFRKCLEILKFIDEPYEFRHKIWCSAIRRDKWTDYDADDALNYARSLVLFKLADMCYLLDGSIEHMVPPIQEILNSSELTDLAEDEQFQYLIKLTYEEINKEYKKPSIEAMDDGEEL